jgi:tetratricopeptide (TPR) repeat protein
VARPLVSVTFAISLFFFLVGAHAGSALAVEKTASTTGNSNPCATAEALASAGEAKDARKAYVAVLQADPASKCALTGLTKLNTPAAESATKDCETGEQFLDVHRNADAIDSFKAALKKDPKDDCATKGLAEAGPSVPTRVLDEIAGSIPTVLIGIGLVVLLLFLLLLFAYWPWLGRGMRRVPLLSLILRPRLTFETLEDAAVDGKPGAPIAARIKERLGRMRDEALADELGEYDLDLGSPREEFADLVSKNGGLKKSLEKASDISDQTKLVAAVLDVVYALLPIPRYEISATLEPPASTGAAATLLLERNTKHEAATTLRSPEPAKGTAAPGAADYVKLADPAAVWIQFEIARSLKGDKANAAAAESHALVREGLDFYHRDDFEQARASYEKALRINRRNWAAYVCLAVAEARLGKDFARSLKHTEEGLEEMKGTAL